MRPQRAIAPTDYETQRQEVKKDIHCWLHRIREELDNIEQRTIGELSGHDTDDYERGVARQLAMLEAVLRGLTFWLHDPTREPPRPPEPKPVIDILELLGGSPSGNGY
jgi:hypothetical protein